MATPVTDEQIRHLLQKTRKIAVIGLSPVPARPSFGVTRYLIQSGYEIFGVRPASPAEILGRPCVESLSDLDQDIDLINVFRNPDAVPGLIDEIEAWMKSRPQQSKPTAIWLQEGVSHLEAEKRAESLGLMVISNRCILKEHLRLT
jgi:uncharacterized protein